MNQIQVSTNDPPNDKNNNNLIPFQSPTQEINYNNNNHQLSNNFRETAQALQSSPVDNIEIEPTPLEVINIDDQGMTNNTDNAEEELKKSRAILQSCISILSNFSIIGLIFYTYFEINYNNEVLFILTTTFQIISMMLMMVRKGKENKKFFLIERMHIFFISVSLQFLLYLNVSVDFNILEARA